MQAGALNNYVRIFEVTRGRSTVLAAETQTLTFIGGAFVNILENTADLQVGGESTVVAGAIELYARASSVWGERRKAIINGHGYDIVTVLPARTRGYIVARCQRYALDGQ